MSLRPCRIGLCIGLAAIAAVAVTAPARALNIVPTYDSTITGDPNAAAIEGAVTSAISAYYYVADPITVSILFQAAHSSIGFLGASGSTYYQTPTANYIGLLNTDAITYQNTIETQAVSQLPNSNSAAAHDVIATSADFRALGVSADTGTISSVDLTTFNINNGGIYDGAVILNLNQPFAFSDSGGSVPGGQYDAVRVLEHEIDEVLGIGGSGSTLNDGVFQNQIPPDENGVTALGPLDLYRYSGPGAPSLNLNTYFSIDGGNTSVASFSPNPGGDLGDWAQGTGAVQDCCTASGLVAGVTPTSPETIALEAIGYELIPEPASIALLAGALPVLGLLRRRRRPTPV
jgi:hypothetical protein